MLHGPTLQARYSPHSSAVKRAIRSESTALNCDAIFRLWKQGSGAFEINLCRNSAVAALVNQCSGWFPVVERSKGERKILGTAGA